MMLFGSIPFVALRGQAGYNLRGGRSSDRRGSTGTSSYRCCPDFLFICVNLRSSADKLSSSWQPNL